MIRQPARLSCLPLPARPGDGREELNCGCYFGSREHLSLSIHCRFGAQRPPTLASAGHKAYRAHPAPC